MASPIRAAGPRTKTRSSSTPDRGLFVVADGMGGHNAGEVASGLAVKAIGEFLADGTPASLNVLDEALRLANDHILTVAGEKPDYTGMGTTVAAVFVRDARSGLCARRRQPRVSAGTRVSLTQLTRDDSWVAAAHERSRRRCTRAGAAPDAARADQGRRAATGVAAERRRNVRSSTATCCCLCSDGVHGAVSVEKLATAARRAASRSRTVAESVVREALAHGATDNVTAVVDSPRVTAAYPSSDRTSITRRSNSGSRRGIVTSNARRPLAIERLKVAERLRRFQHRERERLIGNREVLVRFGDDDDEDAVVRAAFVQLPGRVQIARTIAEHRGAVAARRRTVVRNSCSRPSNAAVVRRKKREQTEVIAVVRSHAGTTSAGAPLSSRLRGFAERQPHAVDLRVRLGQRQPLALFDRPSSSAAVASFACFTFGSSNGLIAISRPAVAVAISQRRNSAPSACTSGS